MRAVYPTCYEIEGRFLAARMVQPSLLAIAEEVRKSRVRNAAIDGGEVTSWVIFDRSGQSCRPARVCFAPIVLQKSLKPGR
jgi:hypothetical protein